MSRNRDLGKLPFETLGGTAGQLLSKASGTDYDFSWIDNYTSVVEHDVKASEAVSKGNVVYISSADGTNMIVTKADYTSEGTSSKTIGLMKQSLALNGIGRVITEGLLTGTGSAPLNTLSATAGDPVWLGANGTLLFGLANKPYAPLHLVFLGIVTRSHAVNGEIFVKVQNGFELQELHNVSALSPATNNTLFYNDVTKLWEARPITTEELPLGDFTEIISDVFRLDGNFGAIFGTGLTIEMKKANSTTNGYLSYSDWIFFNSKQQPITGTGIVKSTLGTITYLTDNSTNWDTAYSDRLKWDGGSTGLDANVGRNSLGLSKWAIANYPVDASGLLRNNGSGVLSWDTSTYLTTNTLLTGLSGGQTVIGGTLSANTLTLSSTSNATKGKIIFGTSAYDEANNRLGIGTTSPGSTLHVVTPSGTQQFTVITGTNTSTAAAAFACINLSATFSPTTTSAASYRTLNMTSTYDAPGINFTGIFGNNNGTLYVENRITSTGTITSLTGGYFVGMVCASQAIALGTVSTVAGIYTRAISSFSNSLTSTVSTVYGSYIAASTKLTLVITSETGQAIEEITAGSNNTNLLLGTGTIPTGNWSIYNSSTRANYINGNLLLGNTTDSGFKLQVTGTSRFNGSSVFATAALAQNATSGFIYIPTCAGAPNGVPATQTGTVATIYDTTNNKLYIYNGAWKSVTLV